MNLRSTMKIGTLNFFISVAILMTLSNVGAERIKLLPDSPLARGEKLVIDGRDAVRGEFPFQVSIQIIGESKPKDGHNCGGSILDENTVLTAAHCFDYVLQRGHYEIVAGINKLEKHGKGQRRKIDQVFKHPNYPDEEEGSKCVINDIAIIRVRAPFIFNDFVNASRLPDADVYPTGDAQVSGWGATTKDQNGSVAETLQVVKLSLLRPEECKAAMERCEARTLLCTKPSNGDGTPWKGDSGGPLFQDKVVVGIVSTGETDSTLAFYTRVSAYRNWIDSKLTSRTNSNSKVQNEL